MRIVIAGTLVLIGAVLTALGLKRAKIEPIDFDAKADAEIDRNFERVVRAADEHITGGVAR